MPALKKPRPDRTTYIQIRLTPAEYNAIRKKADLYAQGNLSQWLRYAATLEPRKEDLEK